MNYNIAFTRKDLAAMEESGMHRLLRSISNATGLRFDMEKNGVPTTVADVMEHLRAAGAQCSIDNEPTGETVLRIHHNGPVADFITQFDQPYRRRMEAAYTPPSPAKLLEAGIMRGFRPHEDVAGLIAEGIVADLELRTKREPMATVFLCGMEILCSAPRANELLERYGSDAGSPHAAFPDMTVSSTKWVRMALTLANTVERIQGDEAAFWREVSEA